MKPPLEPPAAPAQPDRIGPYAIRRSLGEGGMGSVYLAARVDGTFERLVAVKLLRAGLDSEEVLARFRREREVLASLDHPGIARLIDGGQSDEGRPYLVLEYVEGLPIDDHCDVHRLDLHARIELFLQVCDAVEHAHRRRVLHRDLKPANVLVGAGDRARLLDFGVAKLLDPERVAADPLVTREVLRFQTPEYSSPEQLAGRPLSEASDVYSLGALLHCLLTGRTPHEFAGASGVEIEDTVSAGPACRASAVPISAEHARTVGLPPDELRRRLHGDLNAVIGQALRPEPARRYTSAAHLAQDLTRHLAGERVLARPDSIAIRVARFVRRNRLAAALGATILIALGYSFQRSVSAWTAARATRREVATANAQAEERLDHIEALTLGLLKSLDQSLPAIPGTLRARGILVDSLVQALSKLESIGRDSAELRLTRARAHMSYARLLGGLSGLEMGDPFAARRQAAQATAILDALVAEDPATRHLAIHVQAWAMLARLDSAEGHVQSALQQLERVRPSWERLTPQDPGYRETRLRYWSSMTSALTSAGRFREAAELAMTLVEEDRRLAAAADLIAASSYYTNAAVNLVYGAHYLAYCGDFERAIEQGLAGKEALVEATRFHSSLPQVRLMRAASDGLIAESMLLAGRTREALRLADACLTQLELLHAGSPDDTWVDLHRMWFLDVRARIQLELGNSGAHVRDLDRALEYAIEYHALAPSSAFHRTQLAAGLVARLEARPVSADHDQNRIQARHLLVPLTEERPELHEPRVLMIRLELLFALEASDFTDRAAALERAQHWLSDLSDHEQELVEVRQLLERLEEIRNE